MILLRTTLVIDLSDYQRVRVGLLLSQNMLSSKTQHYKRSDSITLMRVMLKTKVHHSINNQLYLNKTTYSNTLIFNMNSLSP
jgi:hypothetical protein